VTYVVTVLLLTVALPIGSAVAQRLAGSIEAWIVLLGAWMTFWAAGVRLCLAGLRQVFQPRFTAQTLFGMTGDEPLPIVRELGFANLSMGVLGLAGLALGDSRLVLAGAIVGGLFYGFAGVGHIFPGGRNARRTLAMATDLWVFLVLAAYVVVRA
jgi:hypothetical protein